MALLIRPFEPDDCREWDQFVTAHPHGSPFHLTGWKKSIEATFRYRPHYMAAVEDGRIRGVLPLFLVKNPLMGKVLISSPFAVYGGILADSPEVRDAIARELKTVAERLQVQHAELRNAYAEQCAGFDKLIRYVTFTQQIGPDSETILASIPRKTRYMVRKALRFPFAMQTVSDLRGFDELYSANLRRLGTPSFPSKHFRELQKNFGDALDVKEVQLEGKTVAAVMSFYFRDQILPYYGAADPAYNEYAPSNFMYFELMRWAGSNGYRMFDFGRSKKESGSFDFKAHWGMEVKELPYEVLLIKRKTLPNFSPNNPRYERFIKLWQKLPLPITRILGPALVKLVP